MSDITGPISSASQMDQLVWTQVSDQWGLTSPDLGYSDVTVETISGVTYVVGTHANGDVDLWSYDTTDSSFTLLATHEGANQTFNDLNDPQIMGIDGKIVIVGGDESSGLMAYSYDPASGATTRDNQNNLVEHTEFKTTLYGSGMDETFKFTASNGETYFLHQSSSGAFDGGQIAFDGSGNLVFDHMVDSSGDYRSTTVGLLDSHVIVGETRTVTYAENYNVSDGTYTVSFQQVGDTIYEYVGGEDAHGAFHVVKWEVDPTSGQLSGSQVIYTDGTTVQDLYDAGYTSQPFPATSPFDATAKPIDSPDFTRGEYLNQLAEEAGLRVRTH